MIPGVILEIIEEYFEFSMTYFPKSKANKNLTSLFSSLVIEISEKYEFFDTVRFKISCCPGKVFCKVVSASNSAINTFISSLILKSWTLFIGALVFSKNP